MLLHWGKGLGVEWGAAVEQQSMGLASEALGKKLGEEVFEGVWKLVSWDETLLVLPGV